MKQFLSCLALALCAPVFAGSVYLLECKDGQFSLKVTALLPLNPNLPDAAKAVFKNAKEAPVPMTCNTGPTDLPTEQPHLIWECSNDFLNPESLRTLVFAEGLPPHQKTWAEVKNGSVTLASAIPCKRK